MFCKKIDDIAVGIATDGVGKPVCLDVADLIASCLGFENRQDFLLFFFREKFEFVDEDVASYFLVESRVSTSPEFFKVYLRLEDDVDRNHLIAFLIQNLLQSRVDGALRKSYITQQEEK